MASYTKKSKILCIRNFIDTFDYERLFLEGEEYYFIEEIGVCPFPTVFVYSNVRVSLHAFRGHRFYISKDTEDETLLKYFYDYFEDIRFAKLKKIKSIYENI